MNLRKILLALVVITFASNLHSQYSVKVMQYNLMQFGNNFSDCNQTTNNINQKIGYLKTILDYVKPDIFTVNELSGDYNAQLILNGSLNYNGQAKYQRATFKANSYTANTIFFNSEILALKEQKTIKTTPRLTDVYELYYKSPNLGVTEDTVFIRCFVTHLKAGSYEENVEARRKSAEQIMLYRKYSNANNSLFMGDFNLYSADEPAFRLLTNYEIADINFNDPINQQGDWNNNSAFKKYHTQSTHTYGDCFSGGGMDDRFDFILVSNDLLTTNNLQYKNDSYKAIGQDGSFFNQSLLSSGNTIPADVKNALYNNSDHLPVYLELVINPQKLTATAVKSVKKNAIDILQSKTAVNIFSRSEISNVYIRIVDCNGRSVYTKANQNINTNGVEINTSKLNRGIYVIVVNNKQTYFSKKIIID